jgi:hypothetical protein
LRGCGGHFLLYEKKKNVFTRIQPLTAKIQKLMKSGTYPRTPAKTQNKIMNPTTIITLALCLRFVCHLIAAILRMV